MTNPISRMIGEKKQWRQYKARIAALPQPHRGAAEAVEHYLMRVGAVFVSDAQGRTSSPTTRPAAGSPRSASG